MWPETHSFSEPRVGVDALTYGLATLVMREDLFEHGMFPNSPSCGAACQRFLCKQCGAVNLVNQMSDGSLKHRRLRRGNYFSQFTKKFSLGNGPPEWVAEYLVTKESGKMLGTLVALSVARMPNLVRGSQFEVSVTALLNDYQEAFVWDMPTGILRDIWIALSSLGDYQTPKLEKLWVRLHDNRAALSEAELSPTNTAPQPAQAAPGQVPVVPAPAQGATNQNSDFGGVPRLVLAKNHREEPNFSIMPPLRSLTVLDIDEIAYLEELSVLIERSQGKLRELRIGFAPVLYSSCNNREQPPLKCLTKGGPLPLLMSKIYDYLGDLDTGSFVKTPETASPPPTLISGAEAALGGSNVAHHEQVSALPESKVSGMSLKAIDPALFEDSSPDRDTKVKVISDQKPQNVDTTVSMASLNAPKPIQRLRLEILEIEKVTLNVITLYKTIDWTILTNLTLLNCGSTEKLWSRLQEKFPPRKTLVVSIPMRPTNKRGSHPRLRRMPSSESLSKTSEYPLSLKRIHTDYVSSTLISFLKHALAPDSLEWLFLQDTSMNGPSSVTLDAIYRGPLRRHRSSLRKVMIDSASGSKAARGRNVAARKWMLTREILTFMSSGKMRRLRELAMNIQHKDWHFFLQRLPNIPHLRSLYIPYIADHPHGNNLDVRDFAMSAIDVVALRPEVELCYLGIKDKCFEVLETKGNKNSKDGVGSASGNTGGGDTDDDDDAEVHHDHSDDEDDDDEDSEDDDPAPVTPATQTQGGVDSDIDPITDDDETDHVGTKIKLKLREILFYEDRISIFKARHGRL